MSGETNPVLPFAASDVIHNISNYKLTSEEEDLLKFGLKFGIPPTTICKSDVYTTFESLNAFLQSRLSSESHSAAVSSALSHTAHQYCNNYKPSRHALKKHSILKKLKRNTNIVLTRAIVWSSWTNQIMILKCPKSCRTLQNSSPVSNLQAEIMIRTSLFFERNN